MLGPLFGGLDDDAHAIAEIADAQRVRRARGAADARPGGAVPVLHHGLVIEARSRHVRCAGELALGR